MHAGGMMMAARDATAPPPVPNAPSALTATAVSGTVIDTSWTDNSSDEDDFELQYDTDSGFSSPITIVLAADTTSHTVTGLASGTEYHFRIRATNVTGQSTYSATASEPTPGTPPAAPSNFSALAVPGVNHTQLWWDHGGLSGTFEAQRAEDSAFTVNVSTTSTAASNRTLTFDGGSDGTTYFLRVRALDSFSNASLYPDGSGPGAGTGHVTLIQEDAAGIGVNHSSPAVVPDSVSAVTVSWTDESAGADATQIQLSTTSDFTSEVSTVQVSAGGTDHQFTGLDDATQYYARLRRFRTSDGHYADWSTNVTTFTGVPTAPTGHAVSAQAPTTIDHDWTDPANHDISAVHADIAEDVDFTVGVQNDTAVGAGTETKQWTGLTEGTQYWLRVRGVNSVGNGAFDTIQSGTQIAAPTSLAADDQGTSWRLNWTNNTSVSSPSVEIHRDTGSGFALFDTVAGLAAEYFVAKTAGWSWKVRVITSETGVATSDFSNTFVDPT